MTEKLQKSQQLALFDVPVLVEGYERSDGTYVDPHVSMRRKRQKPQPRKAASPTQHVLFGHSRPAQQASPDPDPPPATAEPAIEATPSKAAPKRRAKRRARTEVPEAGLFAPSAGISQFGADEKAKPAERRAANAAAIDILLSKTDSELTPDDCAVLARYSGRGGIGDSLNEFYTRPDVASAMWSMVEKLGLPTGPHLEPSAGTGVYLHTAPAGADIVAVELDPTSARIARVLHPEHEVNEASLEGFAVADPRLFASVIGNVPFGLRGGLIRQDKPHWTSAEAYFLDTALDKTMPGGVVALIVPTGVMDGSNNRHLRETLLRKGSFIAAHRLPNTAFGHSHTEVTSDIVLFRRRDPAVAQALATVEPEMLKQLGVWDEEFLSGNYFAGRGAAQVYGTLEAGWRAKAGIGQDITVSGAMDGVADALVQWSAPSEPPAVDMAAVLAALPDDRARERARRAALKLPYAVAKEGDTKVENGVTYILQGRPPRWRRVDDAGGEPAAVAQAREIGERIGRLIDDGTGDASALQRELQDWIDANGLPHVHAATQSRLQGDKDLHRFVAAVQADGSFSDAITGRQRQTGHSLEERADFHSLNGQSFTALQLADELSLDPETVEETLYASDRYALLPDGRWQTVGAYLTGELWPKLDAVRASLADEAAPAEHRTKWEAQATRLEAAIGPKSLEDVEVTLNSAWVPLDVINAFFNDKIAAYKAMNPGGWSPDPVSITFENGLYSVKGGFDNMKLIDQYLNRSGVREDDWPLVEERNQAFKQWLTASEHRERVENIYNRAYTGFVRGKYNEEPIAVPGLSPKFDVNPYHWAGLRWALDAGKGIIAADVGVGKTPRGLILASLLKAYGRAKKPGFVLPKSVLAKWVKSAQAWFPDARIMVIGETYTTGADGKDSVKADSAAVRAKKMHEVAQNDFDFVFISGPAWNEIDLSPERKANYVSDDFWVQRGDSLGNAGDKRVRKVREAYEQSVAKRDFKDRSDVVHFEDLGIDALFTDEAHAYKNLYAARARFGDSPKFLGGSGLSNRALDSVLKCRYIRELNEGRNVFDLTATPSKNSPLEIYSMLSRSAPEAFEKLGIRNSEEFLDRFCVFERRMTLGVNGAVEDALCVTGFKNLDELRGVMARYIDRTTSEQVGIKLPDPREVENIVDMDKDQQAEYARLRVLAEQSGIKSDDNSTHIFSVMDKMAKAATDLELLDPIAYKGRVSPKIEKLADTVHANAGDGGQLIFCEFIDSHEKIKAALISRGFKPSEIAIINADETKSSLSRQKVSDDFNAGKVRVVIGNKTMEEGLDLQENTSDIHHADIPWEPATLQQRNGRGRRQGNKQSRIRLHRYLSRGSFDGYRYQTVAAKRDWMEQLWGGGDRVDNLAMTAAVSREDMLVMLAADPDDARRRIAENKAAAEARKREQGRAEAGGEFVRFKQMSRSYGSMKNKGSQSALRLQQQIRAARLRLERSEHFEAKDVLDSPDSVAVDAQTGVVWRPGDGFTVDAKAAGLNWPKDHSRWVVDAVLPDNGGVRVRAYATDAATVLSLSDLRHGVTRVHHDAAAERTEMSSAQLGVLAKDYLGGAFGKELSADERTAATESVTRAMREVIAADPHWHESSAGRTRVWQSMTSAIRAAVPAADEDSLQRLVDQADVTTILAAHGRTGASVRKPKDLVGLPDAFMEHHAPLIRRHLTRHTMSYTDGHLGRYGIVDAAGQAKAVEGYDVRKQISDGGGRLLLPTSADRQLAIEAYRRMARSRKFDWHYRTNNRRGGHSSDELPGAKMVYPGFEYSSGGASNPMESVLKDLYPGALEEAVAASHAEAEEAAKAGNFRDAFTALAQISASQYGGMVKWPTEHLRLLAQKAEAEGLLRRPVRQVVPQYAHRALDTNASRHDTSMLGEALRVQLRDRDPAEAERLRGLMAAGGAA